LDQAASPVVTVPDRIGHDGPYRHRRRSQYGCR
jgi:hypothetical protein